MAVQRSGRRFSVRLLNLFSISQSLVLVCLLSFCLVNVVGDGGEGLDDGKERSGGNEHGGEGGMFGCQQPSNLPGYSCMGAIVPNKYLIHWAKTKTQLAVALQAGMTGWIALGFSEDGRMNGADVVLGSYDAAGGRVTAYQLSPSLRRETPGQVFEPPKFNVSYTSVSWVDSSTIIRFVRDLTPDGNIPINPSGVNQMIAAWSPRGSSQLEYHNDNFATFRMDLQDTPVIGSFSPSLVSSPIPQNTNSSCDPSDYEGYVCQVQVAPMVTIHWKLSLTSVSLAYEAPTSGWVALGWSPDGSMMGSEVVVWQGDQNLYTYQLRGYDRSYVNYTGSFRIKNAANGRGEGSTIISFDRDLSDPGLVPWRFNSPTHMVWAYSNDGSTIFDNHGPSHRGSVRITYTSIKQVPGLVQDSGGRAFPLGSKCQESTVKGFQCMRPLSQNKLVMHWSKTDRGMDVGLEVIGVSGWAAIGWSPTGRMPQSEVVVAFRGADAIQVSKYLLKDRGLASVVPTQTFAIHNVSAAEQNGRRLVRFTRMYEDGGLAPLHLNFVNHIVWAMSPSGSESFGSHGSNRGSISLDLSGGGQWSSLVGGLKNAKIVYQAHGVAMWGIIGILFPLGIFIAKFKGVMSKYWVYLHAFVQLIATAALVGMAALAYLRFEILMSKHSILGGAVVGLALFQLFWGLIRPKKEARWRPRWHIVHCLLGIAVVGGGFVNIYWGIGLYEARFGPLFEKWRLVFLAEAGVVVVAYLLLSFILCLFPREKKSKGQAAQASAIVGVAKSNSSMPIDPKPRPKPKQQPEALPDQSEEKQPRKGSWRRRKEEEAVEAPVPPPPVRMASKPYRWTAGVSELPAV